MSSPFIVAAPPASSDRLRIVDYPSPLIRNFAASVNDTAVKIADVAAPDLWLIDRIVLTVQNTALDLVFNTSTLAGAVPSDSLNAQFRLHVDLPIGRQLLDRTDYAASAIAEYQPPLRIASNSTLIGYWRNIASTDTAWVRLEYRVAQLAAA